ncbi:MAG: MFS transporter [Limnochordales bacterium]
MILTWLPYYLEGVGDSDVETTGFTSSLVPWASIPGALLVSAISDRTGRRLHLVRALLVLAALSIMGIVYAKSRLVLFACLILYGLVGKLAMDPLVVALTSEWAPAGRMATAMAFLNFAGMASSVLAPYVTGYLTSATGRMDLAFFIAGALLLAGFGIALAMPDRAQASVAPPRQSAIASGLRR